MAAIIAVVVWHYVSKEYAAVTKLSDEYKETDLAVGLDELSSNIKNALGSDNENMNNIEVYCKTLKTLDFARYISQREVPEKHITYGQWLMAEGSFWQSKDTVEAVMDNIEYNISTKQQTLTIQFTDRDAVVAAQMLDSVTAHLQSIVTASRHTGNGAQVAHLKKSCDELEAKYHTAQDKYATFCDTHRMLSDPAMLRLKEKLNDDVQQTYDLFNKASQQYARELALSHRDYTSFTVVKSNTVPIENTSHLWAYLIAIELIMLALTKAILLLRERIKDHSSIEMGGIFSPWALTLIVWGGMMFFFLLWGDELYPLTEHFYISITLWLTGLTVSSFATFNLMERSELAEPVTTIDINSYVFWTVFSMALIMSPWLLYKVYQIVSTFNTADLMKNVRILAVDGGGQGFLNFAQLLSQVTFIVSLWAYPKVKIWVVILSAMCCMCCCVALMEKGTIFLVIISLLYVLFSRRVIKVRTIALVLVSLVGVFFLFNVLREGTDSDYSKNETLLGFIGMYIMSPPVAFCTLSPDLSGHFGINTLGVVYDYLQRFGIIDNIDIHNKMQEYVCVPVTTNVYTVMQPFFIDFGYLGVAFFSMIYGVLSGVIYRKSVNGEAVFMCLYTYMVYILVLQFYQDNLFLSLSFCLQFAVVVVMCTFNSLRIRVCAK